MSWLETALDDAPAAHPNPGRPAIHRLNRIIELLVSNGANLTARNRGRATPLAVAEAPRRNRGGDLLDGNLASAALLRRLAAGGEAARRSL